MPDLFYEDDVEELINNDSDTLFAEIILPFSLAKTFTYRVPRDWSTFIQLGQRVIVPFGKKKFYSGMVYKLSSKPPKGYEARYLHSILDEIPIIDEIHLKFWTWMASYYMSNLGDVMSAALPSGLKLASETKLIIHPDIELNNVQLSDNELLIIEHLQQKQELTLNEAQEISGLKNIFPLVKSLYQKGLILTGEDIRERYKPKLKSFIRLHPDQNKEENLQILFNSLEKKAPKQLDILVKLLSKGEDSDWFDKLILIKTDGLSPAALKSLIDKDIIEEKQFRIDRLDQGIEIEKVLELSDEQEKAASQIEASWSNTNVSLLHGITGSGKSYVYFKLIQDAIESGQQVLYLLPEIALTIQLVSKLRTFFGDAVFITHSKFNENERVEVFQKISSGIPCVVIGPRSSLFLPFKNLGLVVIDEEHDASFKQYDPAPRYQARDSAIYLASLFDAKVVLGSATPAIETYYNAIAGKYALVKLEQRFGQASLPYIELVNMSELTRKNLVKNSFSQPLLDAIEEGKSLGKQSILFQNRKGFVPIIVCKNCGWNAKCISCDISLTYYKSSDLLKCNYCGYTRKPAQSCAACGSNHLEMNGFGTERIEEELSLLMPQLKIERFDQDSTRGKHAQHRLVSEFEDGEIDVLVGTQMITKGLDFAALSVVGVINADQLLNFPHFRSFERAFQLLTQVAGRSGRREERGRVIIQTHKPEHPILQDVINHDYLRFYTGELADREKFKYPPFYKLIEISIKSKEIENLDLAADVFAQQLKKDFGQRILGPETPYVSKVRNYYIRRILLKLERDGLSHGKIKQLLAQRSDEFLQVKSNKAYIIQFDVDPA